MSILANAHFKPGMLHKKKGDDTSCTAAIEHFEKALELQIECDGEEDNRVALINDNLGSLYASRKDFLVAKKHYSSAYSIYEKSSDRDDATVSDCAFRLGGVLEELASDLALDFYEEALRVHRSNAAEDDAQSAEILFRKGRVHHWGGARREAAKCFEEVRLSSCVCPPRVACYRPD